ncbi:hypothetical protein SLS58_007129 [Diplodia intermedia]|uniref:DUF7730 domain-containing protein n=1 Tax=Diplodia intermedia TaxID=856260 RepID=A0ABR3TKU6_9PEZI
MPPSKNGMPFTKDAVEASFDLDFSDGKPSVAKTTANTRDRSRPAAPPLRHLITPEAERKNKISLLTLPAELRLLIYEHLLIARFDRTTNPSWAVGNTNQKLVLLQMIQAPEYRTVEPGILQTCKQVYHEANSILYSQNVFAISEPEQMFRLRQQIGSMNFKLIKALHMWVSWKAELPPWLQLLDLLAGEATGLRYIKIAYSDPFEERGLGDSVDFLRALGKIKGVKELVIEGYYAKHWPAYLEEKMGVRVRAICGHCIDEPELRDGHLSNKAVEDQKRVPELSEKQKRIFRE